jgi:hypothetical protein
VPTVNAATSQQYNKKRIEKSFLEAARSTGGSMIPSGTVVEFEEPDFKIVTSTGLLGIELAEFLPPGDGALLPVEAEAIHKRALVIAERLYYSSPDAVPVRVFTFRRTAQDQKRNPHKMALELVEFVKLHLPSAEKGMVMMQRGLPEGFGTIQIDRRGDKWTCGRAHHGDYSKIFEAFASLVSTKNSLVEKYHANLPGSEIWLLVYSGVQVARSVSIPAGADEWVVSTTFDKVLFFSSLSNPQLIEIARS